MATNHTLYLAEKFLHDLRSTPVSARLAFDVWASRDRMTRGLDSAAKRDLWRAVKTAGRKGRKTPRSAP